MKAAIHNKCGNIAFYLDNSVTVKTMMASETAYDLEGNHPEHGSRMICYACGEDLEGQAITIDWEDTSHAIQQRRVEEEKPKQAGLVQLSSAKG